MAYGVSIKGIKKKSEGTHNSGHESSHNSKKKRPKGTRISLRGRNKAERETSRRNKPLSSGKSDRIRRINLRRSEKAVERGDVKTVTGTRTVSPARTEVITPASTRRITTTKFVAEDVRAVKKGGTFGGKTELPRGTTPKSEQQRALAKARAEGKETVMHKGLLLRAGRVVKETSEVKVPAVTRKIAAVTETASRDISQFKKKVLKRKKRKFASTAVSVNARVLRRVSVTQGKKKKR